MWGVDNYPLGGRSAASGGASASKSVIIPGNNPVNQGNGSWAWNFQTPGGAGPFRLKSFSLTQVPTIPAGTTLFQGARGKFQALVFKAGASAGAAGVPFVCEAEVFVGNGAPPGLVFISIEFDRVVAPLGTATIEVAVQFPDWVFPTNASPAYLTVEAE